MKTITAKYKITITFTDGTERHFAFASHEAAMTFHVRAIKRKDAASVKFVRIT